MKKKIIVVVGTRPNFIKITQFERSFKAYEDIFEWKLLHSGQHFDANMSEIFFNQLAIRKPDFHLEPRTGISSTEQFAHLLTGFNQVFSSYGPDLVIVLGDVNSTLAAALAANMLRIRVAHVESGLRSEDRDMPEEINRLLTDEISEILYVTEESAISNLSKEGKGQKHIFFVGNTMIDTLVAFADQIKSCKILKEIGVEPKAFALVTMHRPSNVDNQASLEKILSIFQSLSARMPVVFPIHPRTRKNMQKFGLYESLTQLQNVHITQPVGYIEFQHLIANARMILTDSGGIQEEATFAGVPCMTLRENTERPSTVEIGTNTLTKLDPQEIETKIRQIELGTYKPDASVPPLWDGHASERIAENIASLIEKGVI